jgi:hypothetical protein
VRRFIAAFPFGESDRARRGYPAARPQSAYPPLARNIADESGQPAAMVVVSTKACMFDWSDEAGGDDGPPPWFQGARPVFHHQHVFV